MNKETKTPKLPKPIAQKPKVQGNLPESINKDGTPGTSYNKSIKRVAQSPNILAKGLGNSSIAATATITGDAKIANKGYKKVKMMKRTKLGQFKEHNLKDESTPEAIREKTFWDTEEGKDGIVNLKHAKTLPGVFALGKKFGPYVLSMASNYLHHYGDNLKVPFVEFGSFISK
jgi:hypothetical protein